MCLDPITHQGVNHEKKSILNVLIVGSILLILYFFVGHGFVKFYVGGKAEMLNAATDINKQCNANGACPTSIEGWQVRRSEPVMLSKDNMLYFVTTDKGNKDGDKGMKDRSFKLVYRFFMPDDWFEVQGGMDEKSAAAVIIGLFIFAFLFLCLVALGLGIAGLIQKDRKKLFATLGTIFSTVILVGTISLIFIGMSMG